MPLLVTLQEYKLKEDIFNSKDVLQTKLNEVKKVLFSYGFSPDPPNESNHLQEQKPFTRKFNAENGSEAVLRGFPTDLITLDVNEYTPEGSDAVFTDQRACEMKNEIMKILPCERANSFPPITRGQSVERYFPSTARLMVEYDFNKCLVDVDTAFQNVKIFHSELYGNVLILDNDINLGESDLVYTETILGQGKEDYTGKTVLLLGGGDGGILNELKKWNPKFITMVDIDKTVLENARLHLRGICYDSLDNLTGDNFKVLIEDCVPILKQYIAEGRLFDYVINDLTAIPVSTEPRGDMWDFLRLILDLSMQVLSPTGKYYTQGNAASMKHELALYEDQLGKLRSPVAFNKTTVFVPSYCEPWVFYEIWKKQCNGEVS